MENLISIKELAQRAAVHPDTIRKWEEAGYVSSIRTLGGHRRYLESEVDHVLHQMKCPASFDSFGSLESDTWFRKDRFLHWKRFVGFHHYNRKIANDQKEIHTREGGEMVIAALDSLSDEDWKSIDKIDEALEPVYEWYRKHHEYYRESVVYNMNDVLRDGTHQAIGGKTVTQEVVEDSEKHYQTVLSRLGMTRPTENDLKIVAYKLDGVNYALWATGGIATGGEESVLAGNGSFPHKREQMELDRKNGWDGISDFSEQRKKLQHEELVKAKTSGVKC